MKKVIKFLENDLPLVISGAALSISVLLATINAITRYTISYTINGADAFITLCFAYTANDSTRTSRQIPQDGRPCVQSQP